MSLIALVLIVFLVLILVGSLPPVGIANNYTPAGLLTVLLVILVIFALLGRI
jgi:hypothetical protein